jgi:Asp-tRNA(Asn)/Glu-tRNA(Gln) amidotransferase A subunit family amidase
VYLVPANSGGGGGRAGGARAPGRGAPVVNPPATGARQAATGRHFNMANIAGYPAISLPHGFLDSGSPTALTLYGRPFKETEILALAKAYQDASEFHLKHPNLGAVSPAGKATID